MGFLAYFAKRLAHEIKKTVEQHKREEEDNNKSKT